MTDAVHKPTDTTALRMPMREDLVRESIARYDVLTGTSKVLGLSEPDLLDAGLMLTDRALSTQKAWTQFNTGLNATDDDPVVARSTWYRFAERFRSVFGQVRAEYAQRIARLTVTEATDDSIRSMTRLARHRLGELVAEKLVTTDDVDEVLKDLPKLAMALADAERAQIAGEKLELDRLNYERRLSETEAKLDLAQQKLDGLPARVKALQQRIDELSKQSQRGQKIDPAVFERIHAELAGLDAPSTQEAA